MSELTDTFSDNTLTTVATFDKYATQYQEKFMAYEPYVETVDQFITLLRPRHKRILDVACGPGNIAKRILVQKPDVNLFGFDLSPKMVKLAKANCPSANFEVKDCRDIADFGSHFDVIIAGFCFPYLSKVDISSFLNRCKHILPADGLLYISTMEDVETRSGIDNKNAEDQVYTYYHQFSFLKQTLEENDFDIITVIRKPIVNQDNEKDTAMDLFIFARKK